MSSSSYVILPSLISILVPPSLISILILSALVTSSSSFSSLVSIVLAIYIEMLRDLGTSYAVYSISLREIIRELITCSVEFFSYYTTC